jgi:cell division protein FtsB
MIGEVIKVLGLDKNKDTVMKLIQFVLLCGAIYGVYADATKNLDAAKVARDKQIAELTLTLTISKEEIANLKKENEHFRQWLRTTTETTARQDDRLEARLGQIESVLMKR